MAIAGENVFFRHVYLLRYLGVTIPSEGTPKGWGIRLQFIFIQIMLTINTVFQLLTTFKPDYELSERSISLVLFLVSVVTQIKLLIVQKNTTLLARLFEELDTPGALHATTDMLLIVNQITRLYVAILVTLLAGWLAYPWLTGNFALPMPYWLPFQVNNIYKYLIVYSFVSFILAVECYTQEAVDTLLLLMAGQICRRLYAIRLALVTLGTEEPLRKRRWKRDKPPVESLGLSVVRVAALSRDETLLKEFIREHVDIIRLIRTFDVILDDIFLAQVMQSTIVSTMYFFLASKSSDLVKDFPRLFVVLVATYIQFYIYCWLGQEITQHNDEIHRTLYLSEWYKCREKIMKSLVIIETFTKSHFTLQGGHLFRIDLKTFVKVLQESFSYFMVLRAIIK